MDSDLRRSQTPLCDGTFIRRRLFDSTSPEADPALILCKYDRVRKQFTLMAGSLLGVTVDSEYKIFDTDLPDVKSSESALTAIVHSVQPYRSTLSPLPPANGQSPGPPIHEIYYARLFKTASTALCLYCWDERYLADVLKNYKDEKRPFIPLVQVYQPEAADFLLKLNDETVFFERGSKTVIVAPDTGLPALLSHHESRKNISSVRGVLDSYAWFLQYLRLTWSIQDGEDPVRLSFKRLQMTSSGKIEPASKEMLESEINDATVHVDETQFYGLTVKNITRVPLFVYIFSFCPHEFKISELSRLRRPLYLHCYRYRSILRASIRQRQLIRIWGCPRTREDFVPWIWIWCHTSTAIHSKDCHSAEDLRVGESDE